MRKLLIAALAILSVASLVLVSHASTVQSPQELAGHWDNLPAQKSNDLIAAALTAGTNTRTSLHVLPGLSHSFYEVRPPAAPWDFPRGSPAYERLVTAWLDQILRSPRG